LKLAIVEGTVRTIPVPARSRTLNELLKKARRKSLILESTDGHRFVLASLEEWEGFEVGEEITQNKNLMKHLSERRSDGKTIHLDEVKAELGL
jgi:PHD/YefM family antitoxin component YafN of YafNO toxin-antitoxin module